MTPPTPAATGTTPSWTELDDAALGAMLRKTLGAFEAAADQLDRRVEVAAAVYLCCAAAEANASDMRLSLEGVTQAGHDLGNWEVYCRQLPTPSGAPA